MLNEHLAMTVIPSFSDLKENTSLMSRVKFERTSLSSEMDGVSPSYIRHLNLEHLYSVAPMGGPGTSSNNGASQETQKRPLISYLVLPSHWNTKEKYSSLELASPNFLRVIYRGPGKTDQDAASIRANVSIPLEMGIFYYEVKIVNKGKEGFIGIGLSAANVSLNRLPGWEKDSYGYHGDDGHAFSCSGVGRSYGPTFTTGDVIGCGINFVEQTVFYTKNGSMVGTAFTHVHNHLYPTIGLRTQGEVIEANFGQFPFVFDIDGYVKAQKLKLLTTIHEMPMDSKNESITVNQLLLSYFSYHGYKETAEAFAQSVASPELASNVILLELMKSMDLRQGIIEQITRGNIEEAIQLTKNFFPKTFDVSKDIMFQLKSQKFVELIKSSLKETNGCLSQDSFEEMLRFGLNLQNEFTTTESDRSRYGKHLEDIFSLLAYADPYKSPVKHLLDEEVRKLLGPALNEAIISAYLKPEFSHSFLDRIVSQTQLVLHELVMVASDPSVALISFQSDVFSLPN